MLERVLHLSYLSFVFQVLYGLVWPRSDWLVLNQLDRNGYRVFADK